MYEFRYNFNGTTWGIFVIPFACSSPVAYIACILIGTVITALIIGVTKPTIRSENSEVEVLGA